MPPPSTSRSTGRSGPATLMDVAAAAGVAPSTVSRVLRAEKGHRVSVETLERIKAEAQRLAYRPNPTARSLRLARSMALGFVVPQLDNPVFSDSVLAAERAARQRGYSTLLMHVASERAEAAVYRGFAESHRIDGLIVAAQESDVQLVEELRQVPVHTVVLNRRVPGVASFVALESESAARRAVQHLIDLGHRRIAHLAGNPRGFNGGQRLRGWRQALEGAGLKADRRLVVEAGYTFNGGAEAMRRLLESQDARPTAVFAATLLSAAGAMSVLHEAGVEIPRQMSVVAVHDGQIAKLLYPPLTTVSLPNAEMGRIAAESLIDMIEGRGTAVARMLAPGELVVRGSTARAAD